MAIVSAAMDDATLERLADLVVGFGANVQPDQIVTISCQPGKERLTRLVAASAYRAGAKFVEVTWFDPYVKRARIEYARDETLDYVPPWLGERMLALGEHRAARIGLSGPVAPGLMADLDPVRSGRDRAAGPQGERPDRQRAHDQLEHHPVPHAGVGADGVPGPRPRGRRGRAGPP